MSEEIKRVADEIAKKHCESVSDYIGLDIEAQMGIYLSKDIEQAIQTQVDAERERCARIASELENEIWDDGQYQVTDSGMKIAEAIRNKPEKE